jgi:hypothetical protein
LHANAAGTAGAGGNLNVPKERGCALSAGPVLLLFQKDAFLFLFRKIG